MTADTPSTRSPQLLPSPPALARLCQSLALLDAIMCPDEGDRYYHFDGSWDEGEQLAAMSNGSGDQWHAHFTSSGAILFGLDHEAAAYRPENPHLQILADVPACFRVSIDEPALDTANLSFCLWCSGDGGWRTGAIDELGEDGSAQLLALLDGKPESYRRFAAEYYEVETPLVALQSVYAHEPLTAELVQSLNPRRKLADLEAEMAEIGYRS